jgi:hypothetical protein
MVYINPGDKRILVPLPSKIGLAVNFGNPRCVTLLSWIFAGIMLACFVVPIIIHPSYFAGDLTPIFWFLSANLAAIGMIRLNRCFVWSDYRLIALASYGLAATGIGFGIQGIINGSLVLWWGADNLSWMHSLVLAPVAAIAQTFGKGAAIFLLLKVKPATTLRDHARYGMLVGLGFTILEISVICYLRAVLAQAPLGYASVWERASASMFHIYSGGLLGLALASRRHWLIALVVTVHASMDWMAFGGAELLRLSIWNLETFFSVCALFTLGAFLIAARAMTSGDSSHREIPA